MQKETIDLETGEIQKVKPERVNRFAKVYDEGWDAISKIGNGSMPLKVYAFIAKNMDHENALVCAIETMADELDCSTRTIMRATKTLQDQGHLVIAKLGTANAYILNVNEVYKNYDQYKGYIAFTAKALASKKQNKLLKKRITHYMGQGELFEGEKQ